jgi:hypothetical protein
LRIRYDQRKLSAVSGAGITRPSVTPSRNNANERARVAGQFYSKHLQGGTEPPTNLDSRGLSSIVSGQFGDHLARQIRAALRRTQAPTHWPLLGQ